jgi:DNA-binding PadR family transcriptional regulator
MLTMDELELLRSYENGPRIWDAASIVPEVWALEKKGLIEQFDPEDGRKYRLTEAGRAALGTKSSTPLADALAVVDRKQNTSGQNGELTALRELAEAVRASLIAFDEGSVRTLAAAAEELYRNDYKGVAEQYLSEQQFAVLDKARELFVRQS